MVIEGAILEEPNVDIFLAKLEMEFLEAEQSNEADSSLAQAAH